MPPTDALDYLRVQIQAHSVDLTRSVMAFIAASPPGMFPKGFDPTDANVQKLVSAVYQETKVFNAGLIAAWNDRSAADGWGDPIPDATPPTAPIPAAIIGSAVAPITAAAQAALALTQNPVVTNPLPSQVLGTASGS